MAPPTDPPPGPQRARGVVVAGHGVASGRKDDARFPGGTLAMQRPHFEAGGLDLEPYAHGTVNLDVAPLRFEPLAPRWTFRELRWHPTEPPEDFSFAEARLSWRGREVAALVYWPHPETKPEHHQPGGVVEVMAPWLDGLAPGDEAWLELAPGQGRFVGG